MIDYSVYIRPLQIEDAEVSYRWRNNPKIWRYTGSRPDILVTPEIEKEWLANVLKRENEKRFAICLKSNDAYIGNIYFTDIKDGEAYIHIFIGDIENWGKRRAFESIILLGIYGFTALNLHTIKAVIDKNNILSRALASFLHSSQIEEYTDEATQKTMTRWIFTRQMYEQDYHLKALRHVS